MISKKDLMYRIDDLCDEINVLSNRVFALEKKELKKMLKKDLKKLEKKTPAKRGPGRPRKNEDSKNVSKKK